MERLKHGKSILKIICYVIILFAVMNANDLLSDMPDKYANGTTEQENGTTEQENEITGQENGIIRQENEITGQENGIIRQENDITVSLPSSDSAITLSSNERVVKSYAELKDALSKDNGITTVYFGNDISIQVTGIRIHPSKINIIVDGFNPLDPNQKDPYTLTDYNSLSFYDTVYIDAAGPKTLTVRDLNITGKNYYGPFSIYASSSLDGITVTYERVNYNGPQIGYHRYGRIRFIDCSVNIHRRNGASASQEFSEAKNLVFEGANTIYTETSAYSVFWHPFGGSFKIANESSLTLTSPSTSATYGIFYAGGSAYDVTIDIGERAVLNVTISGVVAPTANVTLSSLMIREGGAFYLTTTKSATETVLSMSGSLTVSRKSTFIINGYGGTNYAVITQKVGDIVINKDAVFHIIASNSYSRLINLYGRALICNDPASVLLYNTKRIIEASSSAGRVYVNAEQINYWDNVSGGGLNDPPVYSWRKSDRSNFWIDGTLATDSNGNFSSLSSNYEPGDPPDLKPSATNFNMTNARVLSFGRLELLVTAPAAKSMDITGVTAPGATVRVYFRQQGEEYVFNDTTADSNGVFYVDTGISLEVSTVIKVKSNYQYLTAYSEVTVSGKGYLEFTVPERMTFFNTELNVDGKLAKRLDTDWHITVSDTRGVGSEWSVYASLAQPLTPFDNTKPTLTNALVFVNNSITPLTSDGLLIYHHVSNSDNEVSKIHWAADRGILIQFPVNITYSGLVYNAVIEWTLVDGP